MAYVYMLECGDGSLYTGITTDLAKRLRDHVDKTSACAKYTRYRTVKRLAMVWETPALNDARKLEYAIHRLTRPQKDALLADLSLFPALFPKLAPDAFHPLPDKRLEDYIKKDAE